MVLVVLVVVVPAPEVLQHRRKPFQAPLKTAQAGKGGGKGGVGGEGRGVDMQRGGRRPGIEISTLKHL